MPIRKVKGGYKWGSKGKVYRNRKDAERQAAAAYASGYKKSMSWFETLKRDNGGWIGELNESKKKYLKMTPKLKVKIPEFKYPDEKTEIPKILDAMKNKKLKPTEMEETDKKARNMLFGLVEDSEEKYKDLIRDLKIYTTKQKVKYNRKRPYQVTDKINKPKTNTINTPSFPSGHSIEAFGVATVLGHKFPEKKEKLMETAEKISNARVEMGVHYHSDKKVGEQIGKIIGRAYIKERLS